MAASTFIKVGKLTPSQLLTLLHSIVAGLTTEVVTYATPSPTVVALGTLASNLQAAIVARGIRGVTKGSMATTAALIAAAAAAREGVIASAKYVMVTTPDDGLMFLRVGFPRYFIHSIGFKSKKIQQTPRNLRAVSPRDTNFRDVILSWKKPLGHKNGSKVKTYQVWRGTSPGLDQMGFVATTTSTTYRDHNPNGMQPTNIFFYRVIGINSKGESVTSDITQIRINGATI